MIGLDGPVLAKCKTDKSEHHQDGSGYHQPMRILHRGEHGLFPLRLQPSFLSGPRKLEAAIYLKAKTVAPLVQFPLPAPEFCMTYILGAPI